MRRIIAVLLILIIPAVTVFARTPSEWQKEIEQAEQRIREYEIEKEQKDSRVLWWLGGIGLSSVVFLGGAFMVSEDDPVLVNIGTIMGIGGLLGGTASGGGLLVNILNTIGLNNRIDSAQDTIETSKQRIENYEIRQQTGSPILITDFDLSEQNSADGVDLYVEFDNLSDRTLKYVRFAADIYNAVNDKVTDEIRRDTEGLFEITGPFEPNTKAFYANFENAYYGPTIEYAKITKLQVQFMDDSLYETDNLNDIEQIVLDENYGTVNSEQN